MTYLKFTLIQLLFIPMYIIGLVVYPFAYLFRKSIEKNPTLWKWLLLYWFTDASEDSYVDRWYGVYEIYNSNYEKFLNLNWLQKFLLSYKWSAIRNPHWNFKNLFAPKKGVKYGIKEITNEGNAGIFTWRNKTIHGKQFVTWYVEGTKYFRYSFTTKTKIGYINFMAGAGKDRYILKLRVFN